MKKILLLNFLEYIVFLNRLANLPDTKKLEVPYYRYNIGRSHDKEQLESGKPDMMKGSYYANPIFDVPTMNYHMSNGIPRTVGQIYGLVMLCQNLNCVTRKALGCTLCLLFQY
ncbi:uncharacterized protein LOC142540070 isoform X2 [Primulina tabacum]|uniref:uncharacterized protein LOC142540070 isoform X2 n=1 Tax=Primulina tabacum TaxID=48773 RepID=UPI003F59CA8C